MSALNEWISSIEGDFSDEGRRYVLEDPNYELEAREL